MLHVITKSVKAVLLGLGRLNIRHLIMTRNINFYRRCFMSDNNVLRTVFMSVLMNGCDEMLKSISMHKAAAVSLVHGRFVSYVYMYVEV